MLPDRPTPKTERTCPRCGLVFASDKLDGLCPSCLLANTLDIEDTDEGPAFWEEAPPSKSPPARSFSHFELLDELGRGGMGVVYRARDLNTERILALKVLQAHHLEVPDLVQRFRSEVRAVSSLDHPHVLPIHEVGEHDGIPFFSMKLTTGGSLAHCIGNYLGKPREAARLLAKVARGVQHAHERGILHRDLKPGNILLDAAGEPYVCDFGLAKWLEDDRKLTVTAAVLGTPHYIAPEQAHGNKGLTTAVDIYSLGAILYELLTGRPPFVGGTVLETLVASQEKTPDRPSSIAKNVPRDLETICLKALQLEPTARYATAGAFAEDLESYLAGRPIQARPVGAAEQLWRWAKRNPLPAALGAGLVATLAIIAFGATVAMFRIDKVRQRAVSAEAAAKDQLFHSLVAQARAWRLTGASGQRFKTIEAIRQASAMKATNSLRDEAIAALALFDLQPLERFTVRQNADKQPLCFDRELSSVAVAQTSGVIQLWDTAEKKVMRELTGNANQVNSLIHSGSRFVAARCEGDQILVWDLSRSEPVLRLSNCPLQSRGLRWGHDYAFSSDERLFAYASAPREIKVLDTTRWKLQQTLHTQSDRITINFSPDGRQLVVADMFNPKLEVWSLANAAVKHFALKDGAVPQHVCWHPTKPVLAVGCRDYSVRLVSTEDGHELRAFSGHTQDVTQVEFSRDGSMLASTSRDKTIRLWDPGVHAEQVVISGLGSEDALRFASDGRLSASDDNTDAVILETAGSRRSCVALAAPRDRDFACLVSSIDFSASGRLIATASFKGVALWNTENHELAAEYPSSSIDEHSVHFIGDDRIVVARRSRPPSLLSLPDSSSRKSPAVELELNLGAGYILGAPGLGSSGILCLTSQLAEEGVVYDLAANKPITRLTGQTSIWDMVRDPAGRWIATAYAGRGSDEILVWSADGKLKKELPTGSAGLLATNASGSRLITTGSKGAMVWDTGAWRVVSDLPSIGTDVITAAFSPDNRWLAVSTNDRIVLFDAGTFAVFASLENRVISSNKYRLRFSPDSTLLGAQGADNSLNIWDLRYIQSQLQELGLLSPQENFGTQVPNPKPQ